MRNFASYLWAGVHVTNARSRLSHVVTGLAIDFYEWCRDFDNPRSHFNHACSALPLDTFCASDDYVLPINFYCRTSFKSEFFACFCQAVCRYFQCVIAANCVFRTNVTGDFGIVTEDSGPS